MDIHVSQKGRVGHPRIGQTIEVLEEFVRDGVPFGVPFSCFVCESSYFILFYNIFRQNGL